MAPDAPETVTREQKEAFQSAQRPSRASRNNKEKVRVLWPEIRQKLEAGWSVEEVRQELHRVVGLRGSLRTLYRYIKELSLAPEAGPAAGNDLRLEAPPAPCAPAQKGWPKHPGEAQPPAPRKSITDLLNEPL
ncbi:hypothetical protein BN873_p70008 [Candidatus Competibacter denitrificans Run_A_D11]|uniref:Uncharacterized protein n=1 Tax=Candidatus Competibacter denitrificans Run_A_D11 TaxID=1400863 RepID=W6MDA5_9GAMM|nr:hypothetical protein [Candidatus Competibacter denitrificans]CDI04770.1 hypothetical protein BN873_p70008 [Candidatus Competibacter denitrificans Run_A_D11]